MDKELMNRILECPYYKAQFETIGKCEHDGNCIAELGGQCDELKELEYTQKNVGG